MLDNIQQYLSAFSTLLAVSAVLYTWITSRSRGNEKGLIELETKTSGFEKRLIKLEGEMQHLPTKEGQHRLELSMAELIGDMKQMTEALKGNMNTTARMETVLLERGGK